MITGERQMHIVCAVRGGPRIQPSVNRAIELAFQNAARLTFLYILDVEFMKNTSIGRPELVFEELDKMGEFMMLRLCEYSAQSGCLNTDYAIRHGKVREEIIHYLQEVQPHLLVLGRPRRDSGHPEPPAFGSEAIDRFAQEVTARTGVPVELV